MHKRARRGIGWAASILVGAIVGAIAAPALAQAPQAPQAAQAPQAPQAPRAPQGPKPRVGAPPPSAAGAPAAPRQDAPADGAAADPAATPAKAARAAAGYGYSDPPARKGRVGRAAVHHKSGPVASFPGFVAPEGGGSRLSVRLSASVPVEEHAAAGSVTYVLKGARIAHWNDTNTLVTVHFNTPVMAARLVPKGGDLHLVVALRAASTPTHKMTPGAGGAVTFEVDFPKGDFLPPEAGAPGAAPAAPAPGTSPATPAPKPVEAPHSPEPKP